MTTTSTKADWVDTAEATQMLGYARRTSAIQNLTHAGVARRGGPAPAPIYFWREDVERIAAEREAARKPRPPAPTGANVRPCLCCSRPFESEGIHNRLCDTCRRKGEVGDHSIARRRK